jgi:shikimate kinase
MLQQNGIVIYLKASVHDLWQRTRHDRNRPLLQTGNPHAKLTELFQQRDPLYRQVSDIIAQSGKQSAQALMLQLAEEIDVFRKTFIN